MPEQLKKLAFHEGLLPVVTDFDCGSHPCQLDVAQWITASADVPGRALNLLQKESKKNPQLHVWLHFTPDDELVGYSSLGETKWEYPGSEDPPVRLTVIPYMGLDKKFWSKRKTDGPSFAQQIIRHLIFEADGHCEHRAFKPRLLGLYVHPQNRRAIRLYEKEEFLHFHKRHHDDGVAYLGMIRKLLDPAT